MRPRKMDYDDVERRYKAGERVIDIARLYKVTDSSVRRVLDMRGVDFNPTAKKASTRARRSLDDDDMLVVDLYRKLGHTWREIGQDFNIAHSTARVAYERWKREQEED